MARGEVRPTVWLSILAFLTALAAVVVVLESRPPTAARSRAASDTDHASTAQSQNQSAHRPLFADPSRTRGQAPEQHEPVPYIENLVWGEIDLREAQAVMPDNLYWKWGAPTNDAEILEEREQEKKRRNEEYGRVLSGDAGEEEVNAYYDYRERLSTDYLEFAQWMRNRYGETLSEKFRGLLDLSIKLHAARLAQLPSDRERSLEHSRTRAQIRADWQRQKEEFGTAAR